MTAHREDIESGEVWQDCEICERPEGEGLVEFGGTLVHRSCLDAVMTPAEQDLLR